MTDDDLHRRLEALGRRETPMVDPAFADGLEANLRAMAATPARPSLLARVLRPSVVVAALAVLAGVAFFVSRPEDAGLEFAAAEGTSVSIPGSAELSAGVVGQPIPDGTRITVGPDGSATVGGVILDPGTVAIVVNGVVEVVELPPATTVPPGATSTTAAPVEEPAESTTAAAPTTAAPTTEPPTTVAPDDGESTTTEATASTAAAPTTTEADAAATTTTAPSTTVEPSTTTSAPTTTTVPAREPIAPTITLSISVGENGRALLEWTVDGDTDEIAGWVVRRGRGNDAMPAAVIRRPEARRQRVDLPDRNVAWTVVARNADGEVIARSNIVRAN